MRNVIDPQPEDETIANPLDLSVWIEDDAAT